MSENTAVLDQPPVRSINERRASARRQALVSSVSSPTFGSTLFPTKVLNFKSGKPEVVVIGGRDQFLLVPQAFDAAGIKRVLFVGWGSQGPAQAQNLRDTLAFVGCSDIKVCVGLRPDSNSIQKAIEAGFSYSDGTLGNPFELAGKSDLIVCLIADGSMIEVYPELIRAAKPGAIFGISHGFLVGYLQSIGQELASDHDFIMVAPKGMGPSVRKLYLQGRHTEGAGINSSVAILPRSSERRELIQEVANAWSVGIGSPVTFGTDFISEVTSDLFGERSMLLGALWGMTEALFEYYREIRKHETSAAFRSASSGITGTVTSLLSKHGIRGFYNSLSISQLAKFEKGYAIGYPVFDGVMDRIYGEVSSLREIGTVIEDTKLLADHPMASIEEQCPMWKHARREGLYGEKVEMNDDLAFSAGIYVSGLMSQLHTLLHHGHNVSEVINESLIEAVDSLTPYMDSRGVGFMVDNCSTTARLGTRRWGPVFRSELLKALRQPDPAAEDITKIMGTLFDADLHHDIGLCMECRPSVRISIPLAT